MLRAVKPPLGVVSLFLLACAATSGKPPATSPADDPAAAKEVPIPSDLAPAIERAQGIGRQLYILDKVSAIGTDVLLEQVPEPQRKGLRGYLTFQDADESGRPREAFTVHFFTGDKPARVAYEIHVAPDAKPNLEAITPPRPASEGMQLMIRARQTAIAALPETSQPINPVIVPGEKDEVLVYLLAGTTQPGLAVFGKHHRARVAPDGSTVLKLEPLSKSILEVPLRAPDGGRNEGLIVSHIVSDAPIETHVFMSLLHKVPVYVSTARGLWRVNGDRIALIQAEGR